jgi:hypothetical protein
VRNSSPGARPLNLKNCADMAVSLTAIRLVAVSHEAAVAASGRGILIDPAGEWV